MELRTRAEICDPNDELAVERFRAMLRRLGAKFEDKEWAIGVDVYRLKIGVDELIVFSDTWSIDIEGPASLISRLLEEVGQD